MTDTPDRSALRIEGRHTVLVTANGQRQPVAICGICSALIAIERDGELRHLLFHDATDTLSPAPAPPTTPDQP